MYIIDKSIYYYLILFATFLFCFSFIPIIFKIIEQKITSNIPYISLIFMIIALLIYLFVTINEKYYIRVFFGLIGLISISIILFLKRSFDKNNTKIISFINSS